MIFTLNDPRISYKTTDSPYKKIQIRFFQVLYPDGAYFCVISKIENKMVEIGYVYILECSNGKYYTGSTIDPHKRLTDHQLGLCANFTRKYLPIKLVYVETFERIDQAFLREKQIQGWSHKKKEALIASDINSLHKLSECMNESHANSIYSHNVGIFNSEK